MSIRFYAMIPEMEQAVTRLAQCAADFSNATEATKAAADTLAAHWEGDARNAFVAEQENVIAYFVQMLQLVIEHMERISKASRAYTETDAEGARALRAV